MTTASEKRRKSAERGFALLVAVLVSSVVLAVGLSIANVTLKQYIFAGIGKESEVAFYAADAGMECALYWDTSSAGGKFDIGNNTNLLRRVTCMGAIKVPALAGVDTIISSGEKSTVDFTWGSVSLPPQVCAKISVTKFSYPSNDIDMRNNTTWSGPPQCSNSSNCCPQGATCTLVESRGYNRSCTVVDNKTNPDPRVVERALRARY